VLLMSIYLRFKRQNQTLFLHCDATEELRDVKSRLSDIVGKQSADIRCYRDAAVLDEGKTLQSLDLDNDNIVWFSYFNREESDWERPETAERTSSKIGV